ncbi:hypothetical protein [Spiroplasma endosymbiont of Colias croceus]|uniref:hypothetical protein n=1 Tax=Spiroplasma endosymbiont of Colias croceus TaxID=3066310 RepID=UPI0030CD9280
MTKEELAQWRHNELGKIESIITDKKTHKNCINKEKLKSFLLEFYNSFNQVQDKWFQSKTDTYANILEKIENWEFD